MKFAFFAEISANFEEKEWRKQKKTPPKVELYLFNFRGALQTGAGFL